MIECSSLKEILHLERQPLSNNGTSWWLQLAALALISQLLQVVQTFMPYILNNLSRPHSSSTTGLP
jgi:hypothetical protein